MGRGHVVVVRRPPRLEGVQHQEEDHQLQAVLDQHVHVPKVVAGGGQGAQRLVGAPQGNEGSGQKKLDHRPEDKEDVPEDGDPDNGPYLGVRGHLVDGTQGRQHRPKTVRENGDFHHARHGDEGQHDRVQQRHDLGRVDAGQKEREIRNFKGSEATHDAQKSRHGFMFSHRFENLFQQIRPINDDQDKNGE